VSPTRPIPTNYPRVCPRLFVPDADAAISLHVDVLDAVERGGRLRNPGGYVLRSEPLIGDSLIMVSVELPELGTAAPGPGGTTTVMLDADVSDVDAVVARAEPAGARVLRAPRGEFYGDRTATIADPFRHRWGIASHIEDVNPQEMSRRVADLVRNGTS